jgi:glycosyltransferase involved in cell wall biosynthesis
MYNETSFGRNSHTLRSGQRGVNRRVLSSKKGEPPALERGLEISPKSSMASVSVVIPCHNATRFLKETLASIRVQTYHAVETILVNDGSDSREDVRVLQSLGRSVSRYIEQPHLGLPAARNTGFRAASSDYVVPLDADDLLEPDYISECMAALEEHPDAAFVYTDYRVFGDVRYTQHLNDYNLFELLDRNTLTYSGLIRKADWSMAGGYDESTRLGYEDWDFWLRLAEHCRFGFHLPKVLFKYRKHGPSLFTEARSRDSELREKIRASHPRLHSRAGRDEIKARWAPAVCLIAKQPHREHTISDVASMAPAEPLAIVQATTAQAFLIPAETRLDCHSAELCAFAIWGGRDFFKLPDGSLCVSRSALASSSDVHALVRKTRLKPQAGSPPAWVSMSPPWLERVQRHLVNAELWSLDSWRKHPLRSLLRLIPLRAKEWINRLYPVFDVSFYLKFQPNSLLIANRVLVPLRYSVPPSSSGRRRVVLFTPHLGPGGAEMVLLSIAGALDRDSFEIALIATQSHDERWREKWERAVDHVYDLAALVAPERMIAGIYSLVTNWGFDAMLVQNSLAAYSALGPIRRDCPKIRVIDLVHATDHVWDILRVTASVADKIDLRVAISEHVLRRLREAGAPKEATRLIRNGIDLQHFAPKPTRESRHPKTVLFAGRLAAEKRPALLVDIAREWIKLRANYKLRFLVAGDGPESGRLLESVRRAKLEAMFSLLGMVDDIRPLLEESDIVVVPSRWEGIPLIVLEAFATQRPVVCSRVGAVDEAVDRTTGVLVETGVGEARRFAAAIHSLLENPRLRDEMGKAGRRRVEEVYDRSRCQAQYRELFESNDVASESPYRAR